jgi:hypothetical protein
MGPFTTYKAEIPMGMIRRDCPGRRIENVLEQECCLSLSVGDSLKLKLPPMNDLALARRAHMITIGE